MRRFENNDWMFLNNIIFLIHSIEDPLEMRRTLLSQLSLFMSFDSATFYISSAEDDRVLVSPVVFNITPEAGEKYIRIYDAQDYAKGLMFSGKSIIYRESDIMPDEQRVETEYYKSCYLPCSWHYSVSMVITYERRFLGVLTLFRFSGKPDFEYEDIFILEMLKGHLEFRLYRDIFSAAPGGEQLTAGQCAAKYGLTRREETILSALLEGRESDEICTSLCITKNTLKKHILNIYRKLGIKNRVQLLRTVRHN
ncbi:regulatory protein, luxR family [Sporobacter termitidis DSM 10068]|uniref:Regulatory protein, luxR family n=1 Tax=Sporobacter termitidis DSM 10068 TaxID=1123282 RepID=A0A1M5XFU1_9FIRM|nr:helix-turn-helix transcriptional regulator [Sporobacter termitidis]SHH98103.1 regulatory protein, luxR family [Sporobacter termitidis DSM 10068]